MLDGPEAHPTSSTLKWTIGLCVLAVLVLFLGSALYLRLSKSSIPNVEPFDIDSFTSISVPNEKNAPNRYREARLLLVEHETASLKPTEVEAFDKSYDEAVARDWKSANADVRRWLDANHPAMEIWKRGSQLDDSLDVPPGKVHLATDSSLATISARAFARLAVLEAARLTAEGRNDEAWDWYRSVLRSSRHIGMHACTIWRLVGVAIQAIATDAIISWAARPELTAAQLRKALNETLAIDAMTPPASDCFKAEYLATINSLDDAEAELGGVATVFNIFGAREHARRSLRLIFANWLSQVDRPRFQRTEIHRGEPDLYERDSAAPPGFPSAADIQSQCGLSSTGPGSILLKLMLPAGLPVIDGIDREQARRAALILTLALELYDREHGELPPNLEALVRAGYLKSIPADPFGKGEPFHYRRAENPAEGGLLWSVWTDGIDQDGKICVDTHPGDTTGDKCFVIRVPLAAEQRSAGSAPHSTKP
ncbi:MAG TPA: hypothetical protein VG055_15610 [Planctomycetaceae bacterium]|jgi:hypothetical protein|nr:hypothetical protein [Planctomycetaceae bacterium]